MKRALRVACKHFEDSHEQVIYHRVIQTASTSEVATDTRPTDVLTSTKLLRPH